MYSNTATPVPTGPLSPHVPPKKLSPARWAYIKGLRVPAPRWLHVSRWFNPSEVTSPAGIKTTIFIEDDNSRRTYKKPTTPTIAIEEQGAVL